MKSLKKLWMAASVATISMTGCQEEQFEGRPDPDNYYASVETFGTDTRTALGEGRSVVWSSEDRIAIFEGNGAGQAYQVLNAYVGKSSGEFAEVEGLVAEGTGASLEGTIAVYPFNEDLSVTSGDNGDYIIEGVTFPAEQKYIAGSFSDEAFPMTAICEQGNKSLSFKNIGGVLKLSLTGSYSVSHITLTGNSGEPLSGPATVTLGPDGIPSLTMSDDATRAVSLVCSPAVQLDTDNAREFHISIPVTEFETGFTVTVTDSEGNTYRKQTTLANPVMRSTIHAMPSTDLAEDISDEATENYIDLGIGRNAHITSYDAASGSISLEYSSSTIPFIEAGKAFVMPMEQGGDIRVIESHTTSGNKVTLQTSEGNMCDLFKNTSFTLSTSSEPDTKSAGEWNVITPSAYGYLDEDGVYHELYNAITKAGEHPTYTSDMKLWSFEKDYSNTEILSDPAGSLSWKNCKFEAGLNGVFRFDFGEKMIDQIRSKGDIKHFSYELKGSLDIDMLMEYEYSASFTKEDDKIIKENIIPSIYFTFVVGTVPVLLQVDTDLGQEYSFTVSGDVKASAGINLTNEISIGAEWTPDNGLKPIKSISTTETLYDPTLEISASVEAKLSYYPRIGIKIYKFIGPWVEPRPYLAEEIDAGLKTSVGGDNFIGWKAETSVGLDLAMGLELDFIIADKEIWSDTFKDLVQKTIFEAPARISLISPEQGTGIGEGEAIEAVFKAESYSSITDKYYPCPAALVCFTTENGTVTPEMALTDIKGEVSTQWIPDTDTPDVKKFHLTSSITDAEGKTIDKQTLTVCTEEETEEGDDRWVDLGLSVLWAAYNVGASSPEEYGGYYSWGETEEKSDYRWNNYKYYKYDGSFSYIGNEISGTSYDVAHVKWGGGARMPTMYEVYELVENCTFTGGLCNGVRGNYLTGPNGNSVFLPFAGYRLDGLNNEGIYGRFWSGSTSAGARRRYAYDLLCSENRGGRYAPSRYNGQSVRPVKDK